MPYYASAKEIAPFGKFFETVLPSKDVFEDIWKKHAGFLRKRAKLMNVTGLSFEDVLWANTVVDTRSWEGHCLVPIIDLINHANPDQTNMLKYDLKDVSRMRLTQDVVKSQELTHFYKENSEDHHNLYMLSKYGFLVHGNANRLPRQTQKKCDSFLADSLMSSKAAASSSTPVLVQNLQALVREACSPEDTMETVRKVSEL